ncbi:MAG: hypothetical protein V4469_00760 [Patescibacteria group bacterium]
MKIFTSEARAQIVKFYAEHQKGWIVLNHHDEFVTKESPHQPLSDIEVLHAALEATGKVNYTECSPDAALAMIFGPAV